MPGAPRPGREAIRRRISAAEFRRAGRERLCAVAFGSAGGLAAHGPGHGMTDAEIVEQIRRIREAVRRIEGEDD